MIKGLVLLLLFYPLMANSKVINYNISSQNSLYIEQPNVQNIVIEDDFLSDLDKTAAQKGDTHAMGTLANTCLNKKDFSCAYKWASIALRGSYWQTQGKEEEIKAIQYKAKKMLSIQEISDLDLVIKEFSVK